MALVPYATLQLSDIFHVQAKIYFYQPTPAEVQEKTGVEGTHIISPNSLLLFRDPDYVSEGDQKRMRKQWLNDLRDPDFKQQHENVGTVFVEAAACSVPCEYIVNLPIAKKFARDKTYEEMYWRGTNGATFEDVIHSLIPFRETRKMVLGVQEKINVPLHHVQLTAKHHGLFKAEFVPLN